MQNQIRLTAILIGLLALAFFLAGISQPPVPVFDESLYVNGARALLHGSQDLNPEHPPLAKYFIAATMKLAGDTPLGWRAAGAIFGALTLVAIFLWTYLLLDDYWLAITAASLTLFNNFLYVMARVAMLDVFYVAFVMWGVLAFTAALVLPLSTMRRRLLLYGSGVLFGLGTACKWNAVVTLAAVVVAVFFLYIRDSYQVRKTGVLSLILAFVILPMASYVLAYWPLCHRFHRPFTLTELIEMNAFIWRYHVACPGNPALDVPWYRWFFRASPERALSYLMGNFVVAWLGAIALAACVWRFLRSLDLAEGMVSLFYAVNVLQWVIIPQKRLVYYYYFPPAMFLSVALVILLKRMDAPRLLGVRVSLLLTVAAAVFFLYCLPRMAGLEAPYDCMFGCWS